MRTFQEYIKEQKETKNREQNEALGTLINAITIATRQVADDLHAKNVAQDVWKAIHQLLVQKTFDQQTEQGVKTMSMRDVVADSTNSDVFKLLRSLGVWMDFIGKGKVDEIVGEKKKFASDDELATQLKAIADKLEFEWQERGQPFMPTT